MSRSFTPRAIIKKRRNQLVTGILVLSLVSSTTYYLTTPDTTNATTTTSWSSAADFSAGTTASTTVNTTTDSVTLALQGTPVIDTTADDFSLGHTDPTNINTTEVDSAAGGGVTLNQGWTYSAATTPALGNNSVRHSFLDPTTHLLYVSTGGGVVVIDTKNTIFPLDDETLIIYNENSNPALLTDDLQGAEFYESFIDPTTDYLYMVKGWSTDFSKNGLQVVDTKGTKTISDDTFVTSYTRSGSVARLAEDEDVMGCDMDYTAGIIYCVGNDSNRFSVIDTKKTKDPNDDTSFSYRMGGVYNTTNGVNSLVSLTPKVPNLDGQTDVSLDNGNHILYVIGENGLFSLHTQGTVDPTDDLSYFYTSSGVYETTNSSVGALISSSVLLPGTANSVSFFGKLLYLSIDGGLSVIDTQGTTDPGDDTLVTTYTTATIPAIGNNAVLHSFFDPTTHLLYVSTDSGLSVIDTQGTTDPGDDTFVTTYTTATTPAIGDNTVYHSFLDSATHLLYVSTGSGGLSVIDLSGNYVSSALYLGLPRALTDTPTTTLSFDQTVAADHTVSLQYRTGDSDAVWLNDFDDATTTEYLGDYYAWGGPFNDAEESGGTMKLSNPTADTIGQDQWVSFWFDTGKPDGHFPIGSVVTARVRINSHTREKGSYNDYMYNDEWWDDNGGTFLPNNEWQIMQFTAVTTSFSKIGFGINWKIGTWDDLNDSFEIDWLKIETPDSLGHWNSWSTPCTNPYSCPIDPTDLVGNDWIQYKLNLATTDPETTPRVNSVTWSDGYTASGTYTSSEQTFTKSQDLLTFSAEAVTPTGTAITYAYSTDGEATWHPITNGETFPKGTIARSIKWRATLTTTDPTVTPVLSGVTITTVTYKNTTSTSVATQAAHLEAQGKQTEADTIQAKYATHQVRDTEVQREIIGILEKTIAILQRLVELKNEAENK
jgi:hypothetical protein